MAAGATTSRRQLSSRYMDRENAHTRSAFNEYPPSRPFINDEYRRDVTKPIIAYPESNRQGVMSALKNLQDRLKQVEHEKKQAQLHLSKLAANADHVPAQSADVHGRLLTQEERCRALEQQLEQTRVMVHQAERDRADALRKMAELRSNNIHVENAERRSYMEKISDLEREHLRLMATQTLSQNKIKDLEDQLEDERRSRLLVQNKVNEPIATRYETVRPSASVESAKTRRRKRRPTVPARTGPVSARGTVGRKYPGSMKKPGHEPPEHFHVNLTEIPFVTGKSTGRSHSLSANFQEVLSLMKSHNSKLCAGPCSHSRVTHHGTNLQALRRATSAQPCEHTGPCTGTASESDALAGLILQLEEEFRQLSVEHEDLTRQIKESTDQQCKSDLSKALDGTLSRMESKGEQIVTLKRCQDVLLRKGSAKKPKGRGGKSELSVADGHTRVQSATTHTVKTEPLSVRPSSSRSKAQGSLHLLKDLKKIQTSLRADDISWDS